MNRIMITANISIDKQGVMYEGDNIIPEVDGKVFLWGAWREVKGIYEEAWS